MRFLTINLTKTRNFLTKSLNSLHNRPFLTQIQNIGCLFISTDLQSTAIPRISQINRNTHPGAAIQGGVLNARLQPRIQLPVIIGRKDCSVSFIRKNNIKQLKTRVISVYW